MIENWNSLWIKGYNYRRFVFQLFLRFLNKSVFNFNVIEVCHTFFCRLAKIDLVMFFDCDFRWYCTIDYVIVNYIWIIFSILFNDFLAINHPLRIIFLITRCEHGSVLDLLLSMWEVPGWFTATEYVFIFDMQHWKWEDNLRLVPNFSYSNNLVKIRVFLRVFRHAESKSLFHKEVLVILCWNPWQFFQVFETQNFFGRN